MLPLRGSQGVQREVVSVLHVQAFSNVASGNFPEFGSGMPPPVFASGVLTARFCQLGFPAHHDQQNHLGPRPSRIEAECVELRGQANARA